MVDLGMGVRARTGKKGLPGRTRLAWAVLTALVTVLAAPGAVQAATCSFQGPGSDWNTAANWSCASVPTASDDVVIPMGANAVLDSGADGAAKSVALQTSANLAVSAGRTLAVGTGASSFAGFLAVNGQAVLRLGGATTWSSGGWNVGGGDPYGGTVENAGALEITGDIAIYDYGAGLLRNLAGGTIEKTSPGSEAFYLPLDNDGALTVSSGGLELSSGTGAGETSVGSYSAAAGATLAFGGQHSLGAAASLGGPGTVRYEGGTTTLASGATYDPATSFFSGGSLELGGAGSTGRIVSDGEGGTRFGAGTLTVGTGASNFDNITFSGGTTTFAAGSTVASTGFLAVNGQAVLRLGGATTWSSGGWNVGGGDPYGGTVENAGALEITGDIAIYDYGAGLLRNLAGGTIEKTSPGSEAFYLPLDNDGDLTISAGRLDLSSHTQTGGTTTVPVGTTLGGPLELQGGVLRGAGTVDGPVNNSGGTVRPGTSPGTLTINSNYTQGAGGTLESEIQGTGPGTQFDRLVVNGNASLDGALRLVNGSGFDPAASGTFEIVKTAADGRSGQFSQVSGDDLGNERYVPTYGADNVTLVVEANPAVTIGDATVTEGNSGQVNATFTVNLNEQSTATVKVDYATADGSATAPGDYTAASGTVTFAPGDTAESVTVQVKGDALDEPNETFGVNLSNPQNATLGDATGAGTITDDDDPPAVSIGDASVTEGNAGEVGASFEVALSRPSGRTVTAAYATADGSATAAEDYTSASGTVTFAPGDTTENVTVQVKGDALDEPNETFGVNLSNPQNATLGDATGAGTITDDDDPPAVSIGDASVTEGNAGEVGASFEVALSRPSGRTVTAAYATADGSATAAEDYTSASGTVTFAPGDTTENVTVQVKGDALDEPNETFGVNLSNPQNATLGDAAGVGTIIDDDDSGGTTGTSGPPGGTPTGPPGQTGTPPTGGVPGGGSTGPGKVSLIGPKSVTVAKDGTFSILLGGRAGDRGVVALVTARAVKASSAAASKAKATKPKPLALASKAFTIAPTGKVTVKFKLSSKGFALLRARKSIAAKATATVGVGATKRTDTFSLTLRAPKEKKKKKS